MSQPQHRLATWSDAEPLYKLYQTPANRPFLTVASMDYPKYVHQFRKLLVKADLFIYHQAEEIIGSYRLARKLYPLQHVAKVTRLVIAEHHQHHGHGYRMLSEAQEYARSQSILRLELMVEVDNHKAIALYDKCGFTIEGRLTKYFFRPATGDYVDEYIMAIVF